MTKALYLENCYLKSCNARVVEVDNESVVLDETVFYPSGGGQPSDRGMLLKEGGETFNVLDVRKQDGKIVHKVDRSGLEEGDNVHARIDWERRYLLMRMHTAAHILSGIIHNKIDALITGNQLDEQKSRIDFNLENFDREKIQEYEDLANQEVRESRDVIINLVPKEEVKNNPSLIKLAKALPPAEKLIRTVNISGLDVQACGGTHLKNTSEVGTIKIVESKNKGANNRRIYYTLK